MLFIAKQQSELRATIAQMLQLCKQYRTAARSYVDGLGAASYYLPFDSVAGGIDAVIFPQGVTPDPKLWKKAPKHMGCPIGYVPRTNTQIARAIAEIRLHMVTNTDVTNAIGFQAYSCAHPTRKIARVTTYFPGIYEVSGTWVFDYPDGYNLYLHPDLEEITYAQYNEMKAALAPETPQTTPIV